MQRIDFYILIKLKGSENSIKNDVYFINNIVKYINEQYTDEVISILGVGLNKNIIRDKYNFEGTVIGNNQLYAVLHTKDFSKVQAYMYYTTQVNGVTNATPEVDYVLLDTSDIEEICLGEITRNSMYLNIQRNYIPNDIINKLINIRKDINKQKNNYSNREQYFKGRYKTSKK